MRLALIYALLAALATLANIATQDVFLRVYQGAHAIALSILAGTLLGLVLKYALDKRFIFAFQAKDLAHDSRVFLLYAAMGGFTTLLFWGTELLFHALFATREMRYLGAVIGLAAGYWLKFILDRRFVFRLSDNHGT
ncbi:GtrA family protein [Pseudomonas sp. KB-10]|uniref:GtrA family protein n=1 Tax=Pseudomonas sp. KB-10 TaxID=2292264 RepID=UPI001BAEB875|nr:GtrA family protein [Pseudomonas sp. KB-10]